MHKKLKKYIERYDTIEGSTKHELIPNGGMIALINQGKTCEIIIETKVHTLENCKAILINAYEVATPVQSSENLHLLAVRFKGAGASFFYEEHMDTLMQVPTEPIFIEDDILEYELDTYLQNRFRASKLPFNIMKIIALLDEKGSTYTVDEILAIANVPRKILDKIFRLRTGLTFKTYASLRDFDA